MSEEIFDIYDSAGNCIGTAPRSCCHGDPSLLHRAIHVVVFHPDGKRMLLQKRLKTKRIQPGKWDSAVGGHLASGEDYETAARRELAEELGISTPVELKHLFDSRIRNEIESEDVRVFSAVIGEGFKFDPGEIETIRFWTFAELENGENRKEFTPQLCFELDMLKKQGKW